MVCKNSSDYFLILKLTGVIAYLTTAEYHFFLCIFFLNVNTSKMKNTKNIPFWKYVYIFFFKLFFSFHLDFRQLHLVTFCLLRIDLQRFSRFFVWTRCFTPISVTHFPSFFFFFYFFFFFISLYGSVFYSISSIAFLKILFGKEGARQKNIWMYLKMAF